MRENLPEDRRPQNADILRMEARMKGKKLIRYFGNERNVESIDGVDRLVRFFPQDLVRGHQNCFLEVQGVFSQGDNIIRTDSAGHLAPLGRLLATIVMDPRCQQTLPDLLVQLQTYTGVEAETLGKIRKAGNAQLARLSNICKANLFSDDAYALQPGIVSRARQKLVLHVFDEASHVQKIAKAYRPADQPFYPPTEATSYLP